MLSDRTKSIIQMGRMQVRNRMSDLASENSGIHLQQIATAFSSTPEEDKQRKDQLKKNKEEIKELQQFLERLDVNPLENVCIINEASKAWGMTEEYIEELCVNEIIKAIKIGNEWLVDTLQPNPKANIVK
ncbi:hypothetical protein [Priestia megaterium]|uniref:Uncharacterized protein n=1 Tax=Priestia megaterium TaxID=1404 RepID=A0A6M6DTX3_PRIMG|nr:hypothetical protein [Priestia megaterium]QJX74725.1 hypothetical protein FDZ14_00465 [Priestia megaterium]